MKKAKVIGYDGKTLSISFLTDDEQSSKRFDNKELKEIIIKTLKPISQHAISLNVSIEKLSDEDNEFMQEVYKVFPDDLVSIE